LLADAASPPPRAHGEEGHAGLLSFEFSHGKERIIVNCGAVPMGSVQWRNACAATAAHSTLTLSDTNACDIDEDGGILGSVQASSQRFEEDGSHGLEMAHDGYRQKYGIVHNRILRLSGDGETLMGREILQSKPGGKAGRDYAVRWHLHPGVQVSLSHGGQTALLRTPLGTGWRLRIENETLGLESSVYCGNAAPRRSMQIKATGVTQEGDTFVTWSLTRERK
jgi:uncharacterized heparinase superfamily protein